MAVKKESLGRMAHFLLPMQKVATRRVGGKLLRDHVHEFLLTEFASYSAQDGITGWWRDPLTSIEHFDLHTLYKVSFVGKDRIPVLEAFLERIAAEINEICIYLETGEDAWLIYANERRTQGYRAPLPKKSK